MWSSILLQNMLCNTACVLQVPWSVTFETDFRDTNSLDKEGTKCLRGCPCQNKIYDERH